MIPAILIILTIHIIIAVRRMLIKILSAAIITARSLRSLVRVVWQHYTTNGRVFRYSVA